MASPPVTRADWTPEPASSRPNTDDTADLSARTLALDDWSRLSVTRVVTRPGETREEIRAERASPTPYSPGLQMMFAVSA